MRQLIGWVLAAVLCTGLMLGCDQKKDDLSNAPPNKSEAPMFPENTVPKAEPAPAPAPAPVDNTAAEPAPKPAPAPKEHYAPEEKGGKTHVVAKGETLQKISEKYYGTTKKWKKILDANKDVIKDPAKLKPGTKIKIP
jgi:nucleoid-associated protein YgaU